MCVHVKPSPFTTVMLIGWTISGVALFFSSFLDTGVSVVIPASPPWAEAAIGTFFTLGGSLALWGSHYGIDLSRKWRLDELGMWLVAGGWATYTVVAFIVLPTAPLHWIISFTSFLGSVVRIVGIHRRRTKVETAVARFHSRGSDD
mgnify:CR=1 FL=1